jgi:O-antigen ligase
MAEFSFLVYYFYKQEILKLSGVVKTLFCSSIFFSLIGIAQFINGGTIGGLLYFLGERSFNMSTPGIALVSLNGAEYMRAYSTFSHPNSLAGYLGTILAFILLRGKLKKSTSNFVGVLIILTCFLLTFSVSGYLGILLVLSLYAVSGDKKVLTKIVLIGFFLSVVASLTLPLVSPWILESFPIFGQNISQRLDLAYIAGLMISQRFLIGKGLGSFIVNIPAYKGIFSFGYYAHSWLLQPVHNIFLLVFSELGILGLLAFCFLLYKILSRQLNIRIIYLLLPFIFILFTGLFDHYTITLQQNLLLFSVFIGISINARIA